MGIREAVIKFTEFVWLRIRLNYVPFENIRYVPFEKNTRIQIKRQEVFFEVLRNYWLLKKESVL